MESLLSLFAHDVALSTDDGGKVKAALWSEEGRAFPVGSQTQTTRDVHVLSDSHQWSARDH